MVLRVVSLGAGVQSTTMLLMAAKGEITPMPDCAIFADTGWEPEPVYAHLLNLICEAPFPVHVVRNGNIKDDVLLRQNTTGGRFASIPWYTKNPDGSKGMGRRQCTKEYKLTPIKWKIRDLLGVSRRGRIKAGAVEMWIGISTDEAARMKPSRDKYIVNKWPLIDLGFSRLDCEEWLLLNGYAVPPKSACIGCPFHNDALWSDMKYNRPDEWVEAVHVDEQLRANGPARGMHGLEYMHPKRVPLKDVPLTADKDNEGVNHFINECEGMCGV